MKHITVLLVDDEVRYLETATKILRKRGFGVFTASNGDEALAILRKGSIDVVFLDVMMPGFDGIAVLKAIKRQNPDIKVVMLTGHATVESAVEGLKLGADDYILKPVDVEEMACRIRDTLEDPMEKEMG